MFELYELLVDSGLAVFQRDDGVIEVDSTGVSVRESDGMFIVRTGDGVEFLCVEPDDVIATLKKIVN